MAYEFLKKRFNSKDASYSQLNRGILDNKNLSVEHTPFYISAQV